MSLLYWLVFIGNAGLPAFKRVVAAQPRDARHPEQAFSATTQEQSGGKRSAYIPPADSFTAAEMDGFVIYEEDGRHVCRQATPEEALKLRQRDPDSVLRTIAPSRRHDLFFFDRGADSVIGWRASVLR